jgi:hypothetical protein
MNIEEVRAARTELEGSILDWIADFKKKTGVSVEKIEVTHLDGHFTPSPNPRRHGAGEWRGVIIELARL